ncbi:MAG: DUF350 domain-containing protein [Proteobacteria bacterium]|nr:DUF350 domain-containing protein [Pseudomonadota bacterium]
MNAFTIMGTSLVYILICIGFTYIAWLIADWRTKDMDDLQQIEEGNMAVGMRRFGLLTMLGFGFCGVLSGSGSGFVHNILALLVDGVLIIIFAFACRHINDVIMMGHIDNDEHCKNGNVAVGIVEAANYMATGLILWGAFAGNGMDIIDGALSSLIWFLIGQSTLLVIGWIVEVFFTKFNIRNEIKDGNVAAGVFLAGVLVPLGIIIRSNLMGPSKGLVFDIVLFAAYMVFSLLLLVLFSIAFDHKLLPKSTIKEVVEKNRNVAGISVGAAVNVLVALVISATL